MRLPGVALALVLAAPAAAGVENLTACPAPPTGYEAGVQLTANPAYIPSDVAALQALFSTRAQGSDDALETLLASISGANPEYRIQVTDTVGTPIKFAQVRVGNDASAVWDAGFKLAVDADDGGRVCVYVDTDESLSADASDATSSGGFSGWDLVYFGGSLVNWADSGSNALTGANSPTSDTSGPFGGAHIYDGVNQSHEAANTGASAEFANVLYGSIIWLESTVATDADTTLRYAMGRSGSNAGESLAWSQNAATTRSEYLPPCGAAGCNFNEVAADTLVALGITQNSAALGGANQSISWRGGVGAVTTWSFAPSTPSPTDNFHFGQRGNDANYWPGKLYGYMRRDSVYTAAEFTPMAAMGTNPDEFWTVELISTATPRPVIIHTTYYVAAAESWTAAPASSADACDQVWAALGYDAGSSTPTGNQFLMCSPEGVRLQTGFVAQ